MSKVEKLIEKLKSKPKDFTWDEMIKVLNYFGDHSLQPFDECKSDRLIFICGKANV